MNGNTRNGQPPPPQQPERAANNRIVSFESDPLLVRRRNTDDDDNDNNNNAPSSFSERTPELGLSERSSELVEAMARSNSSVRSSGNVSSLTTSERWKEIRRHLRTGMGVGDVLKLITLTEREKATNYKGVGKAAFLIRDAVLGKVENPANGAYDPYANPQRVFQNAFSIICRRICSSRPTIQLLNGTAWILLLLSFVEPPSWCSRNDGYYPHAEHLQGCRAFLSASGVPATVADNNNTSLSQQDDKNGSESVAYYPNSHSMLLTLQQSALIEAIGLGIIFFIILLRLGRDGLSISTYLRPGASRWNRIVQLVCLVAMSIGLGLANNDLKDHVRVFHPYLRLALFTSLQTGVQRDLNVLLQMLPEVFNVLTLLGVFMTFYAWFGCVMFVGTPQGQMHFPSLVEALWTLWICVTTANYPDVMMPSYNQNRWTAVYFVSFMVLTFFFLMNVILASVVNEYDTAVERRTAERIQLSTKNLKQAFALMDPNETGRINRDTVMGLFLILNEDFPEFRTLSDEDTSLLFAILDKDGTGLISEEEFMDFGNVIVLEFTKTSDYATLVERNFPKTFSSGWYQRFCKVVKSDNFEYATDLILVLNAIVIGIQSYPELSGGDVDLDPKYYDGSIDTVWELVETCFTGLYAIEVIIKLLVLGWKRYVESAKNVFDFTITILAVASTAIVYYPNAFSDTRIIRMIVMARVLRLIRLLTAMKRFQLIGAISAEILPAARSVVMLLFLLMYLFSATAVTLFGGKISRDPDNKLSYLVLGTEFSDSEYWANNFNDMVSGMNVLFNLLVVNNWTECEIGFEAATQSKWVRLFFLSFHILGVILVNNLVIALIINEFLTHLAVFREKTDAEVVGEGEAVLYRQQAIFEGSQITGTKTSLSGNYIARIRYSKEDGHVHERLRRLFTKSSSAAGQE